MSRPQFLVWKSGSQEYGVYLLIVCEALLNFTLIFWQVVVSALADWLEGIICPEEEEEEALDTEFQEVSMFLLRQETWPASCMYWPPVRSQSFNLD